MPEAIKAGDIVQLKSGGPEMTVIKPVNDNWFCQWFENKETKGASFPAHALRKIAE